jgi:hypothetical protein
MKLARKPKVRKKKAKKPSPTFRRPALSKKRLDSQNRKFFFSFLKKIRGAQNLKKCRENFSVLERKFLQNLRAEAGAKNRNRDFLQKKF